MYLRIFGKRSMTRWVISSDATGACDKNPVDLLRARADRAFLTDGRVQARRPELTLGLRGLRGHGVKLANVRANLRVKRQRTNA